MNKEQKAAVVDEIAERLGEADAIFAVDYRGISVPEAAELRAKLRDADAVFTVVKNRLAKRAAEKAGTTELEELFDGPIALAFVKGDAVVAAKAISTFSREHEVLEYRGGIMDGEALDPEKFNAIARLPGLDVLHGQLVGVTASPLTGLTRGLASMLSGLAVGLGQIAEQGLVGGGKEPAAEEEPAGEVEAEEEPAADVEAEEEPAADVQAEEEPASDPDAPGREAEEADGSNSDPAAPASGQGRTTSRPAGSLEAEEADGSGDSTESESDEGSGEAGSEESEAEGEDSEEDEK